MANSKIGFLDAQRNDEFKKDNKNKESKKVVNVFVGLINII